MALSIKYITLPVPHITGNIYKVLSASTTSTITITLLLLYRATYAVMVFPLLGS